MRRIGSVLAAGLLVGLAACGGDDAGSGTATPEEPPPAQDTSVTEETPEPMTDTETGMATGGATEVMVAETSLGEVLVDGEGMTLYMFDPDEQGESTCYEDCATAWPPLVGEGEPALGEGLDEAMVGSVERTDGTMQVTYNDWPLYYWQNDAAAGDVTGQAVNDVWWVLGADGEPIRTAPEATS
jgi:predicted lipoprotein with Yx(FWY)xxD motif